jgi:hypothetical protein
MAGNLLRIQQARFAAAQNRGTGKTGASPDPAMLRNLGGDVSHYGFDTRKCKPRVC